MNATSPTSSNGDGRRDLGLRFTGPLISASLKSNLPHSGVRAPRAFVRGPGSSAVIDGLLHGLPQQHQSGDPFNLSPHERHDARDHLTPIPQPCFSRFRQNDRRELLIFRKVTKCPARYTESTWIRIR